MQEMVARKTTILLIDGLFYHVHSLTVQLGLSLVRVPIPKKSKGVPTYEPFEWGNMDEKSATPGLNLHFVRRESFYMPWSCLAGYVLDCHVLILHFCWH